MEQQMHGLDVGVVPMPDALKPLKPYVDPYVGSKIRQFAAVFTRRVGMNLAPPELERLIQESMQALAEQERQVASTRSLRLVLRHDCQSTGCGEMSCHLCQYNPSRLCKRNLKNKYLIDDHLKAKCSAPLRVELVDESSSAVPEGLPADMRLEVHVLNGERYKEVCPDNTLLSHGQLKSCIIAHHQKALLRREGGSDEQLRCFLQLERGLAPLSDLQVTTSSEALLAGKAPTFRLLVWAVGSDDQPVPNVTYVVSESFVVATKRVKHAIKSDIPNVADSVSKLIHIGKATVDKLQDLRRSAIEEGFEIQLSDDLNHIEKVGQFRQLVELAEMNSDLKNKLRHLLKLSPEKWEEVAQHALSAVVPDFRPRVWWCPQLSLGLQYACKNGAVSMDHPTALIKGTPNDVDGHQIIPLAQLDPGLQAQLHKLRQSAMQSWYAANHPGWGIFVNDGQNAPSGGEYMGGALPPPVPAVAPSAGGAGPSAMAMQPVAVAAQAMMPGAAPVVRMPTPPVATPVAANGRVSPFSSHANLTALEQQGQTAAVAGPSSQPRVSGSGQAHQSKATGTKRSPFEANLSAMHDISHQFPVWQGAQQHGGAGADQRSDPTTVIPIDPSRLAQQRAQQMEQPGSAPAGQQQGVGQGDAAGPSGQIGFFTETPSLEMLTTEAIANVGAAANQPSLWASLPSTLLDPNRSGDLLAAGLNGLNSGALLQAALAAAQQQQQRGPAGGAEHGAANGNGEAAPLADQAQRLASGTLAGGGGDRQLSLKFSMSLDLDGISKLQNFNSENPV